MKSSDLTSNGWQNSGWFLNKAENESLNIYEYRVYLAIVRKSVGYGEPYTKPMAQSKWAEFLGISRPLFTKTIKSLIDKGLIKRTGHYGNLKGGGSTPYAYGPVFPKDFKIWLKGEEETETKTENKQNIWDRI